MKLVVHENTRLCYIRSESADDQFILGKLSEKIAGAEVQEVRLSDGVTTTATQRELNCSITALIEAAAK